MRTTIATTLLAVATLLGLSTTASAQPWDDRPNLLPETPHGVWGELALYTRGDDPPADPGLTVFSPMVHAYFGITNHLELAFDWGFAVVDANDSDAYAGNPFFGIRYVNQWRQSRLRIGGGLAVPVAGHEAHNASFIRGIWSPWLWYRDEFSIVVPEVRFEHHGRVLYFAVEGALATLFYTGDGDPDVDDDVELVTQVGAEIGVRFAEQFIVGGRFQAVWFMTDGGDNAQAAMAPFFQVDFGQGFVFTRLLMNLDGPLGFAFDEGKLWSLQVGGGARF